MEDESEVNQLGASLYSGAIAGGVDAAIAVGLTVTFGMMGIVNFAHGGFLVLGGFVAFECARHGLPLWSAVLIAMGAMAILGGLCERVLFRQTLKAPVNGLIISIGLLAVTQASLVQLFGTNSEPLAPFTYKTLHFFGERLSLEQTIIGLVGFATVSVYWGVVSFTRFGLKTRAVAQDREVASLLGVEYGRYFTAHFAIGASLAALAGALVATVQPVSAFSALGPTTTAITVIIIGTLGSIPGVLLAGLLLGLVQELGVVYVSTNFAGLYPFLLLVLVLAVKPAGLFGGSNLRVRAG